MVRQVSIKAMAALLIALFIAAGATCTAASAATYSTYDGNISSSQLSYYRDIVSNINLSDNYVCFRSGQYEYNMVVGDLDYSNGVFSLNDSGRIYTIDNNGTNYSSYYTYNYATIDNFTLNTGDKIVYSDLGNFPQLEDRGAKYEILQTILISTVCVCVLTRNIFYFRKR